MGLAMSRRFWRRNYPPCHLVTVLTSGAIYFQYGANIADERLGSELLASFLFLSSPYRVSRQLSRSHLTDRHISLINVGYRLSCVIPAHHELPYVAPRQ